MNTFSIITLLAATCVLAPSASPAEPTNPKTTAPQPVGLQPGELETVRGFQFSLTADSGTFAVATPIRLNASITNVTEGDNRIAIGTESVAFRFEVKTSDGKLVPLTRYGQRLKESERVGFAIGSLELGPKENWTNQFILNQMYDMTVPGEYTVKVSHGLTFTAPDDPKEPPRITSNMLHITVN